MRAIWLIIHREYVQRIRKRSFLILTMLGPAFFALLLIVPAWISIKKTENPNILLAYDPHGVLPDSFSRKEFITLRKLPANMSRSEVFKQFSQSDNQSLLYIHNTDKASLFFHNDINPIIKIWTGDLLNQLYFRKTLLEKLGEEKAGMIPTEAELTIQVLDPSGRGTTDEALHGLSMLSGVIIYLFIITYTMQVMRGVVQEKSNRVIEILLTSVKPFQLMLGKIAGIALISLTQFSIWLLTGLFLYYIFDIRYGESLRLFSNDHIGETINNHAIDIQQALEWNQLINTFSAIDFSYFLLVFGFYFVFGYLFYSAIFAAIGASVDSETDTQPFIFPLTLPILISFTLYQTIVEQPDSSLSVFFSIFPFTSPVTVMFLLPRHLPLWQLLGSMLSLIASFILIVFIAAKIYRTGILMYGKKITLREMLRWIKN